MANYKESNMERKQVEDDHDQEEEEEVGFKFVMEDRTTSLLQDEDSPTYAGDEKPALSLGEVSATDENGDVEDGFKTPPAYRTGPPVARECPPAPRKGRPVRCSACRKRKAASGDHDHRSGGDDAVRRDSGQQLDLSLEVEALFPPALLADFRRKIKKARQENYP